jgi:hypothetical protein
MIGRVVWRVFVALFGLLATAGAVWMAVKGFHGGLPAAYAGLGWAFLSCSFLASAFVDVVKAIGTVVEKLDAQ